MTEWIWTVFDVLLAGVVLALAWMTLTGPEQRWRVVFFIAFGLAIALVWARLKAPDVALAEAAIGAGLSGALLLAAIAQTEQTAEKNAEKSPRLLRVLNALVSLLSVALAGVLGWAYVSALGAPDTQRLQAIVRDNLEISGVSNPVTAVLLNFRGYDTLLELAVLLTALLGIAAMAPARPQYASPLEFFVGLVRLIVPALLVMGGYLLWAGAHAPGGAFQAGALLAAAGVLLRLTGHGQYRLPLNLQLRVVTAAGVGVFATVGLVMLALGGAFLQFPIAWAGSLILLIETAATFSIAAILVIAFLGGRPTGWEREDLSKNSSGRP